MKTTPVSTLTHTHRHRKRETHIHRETSNDIRFIIQLATDYLAVKTWPNGVTDIIKVFLKELTVVA